MLTVLPLFGAQILTKCNTNAILTLILIITNSFTDSRLIAFCLFHQISWLRFTYGTLCCKAYDCGSFAAKFTLIAGPLQCSVSSCSPDKQLRNIVASVSAGLTLSVRLSHHLSHLGPAPVRWHHRRLGRTAGLPVPELRWQAGGGPSVLCGLPAAPGQDEEAEPQVDGRRKRMLWDEDGPHRLHQRAGLLETFWPPCCSNRVMSPQPTLRDLWPPGSPGWSGGDFMLDFTKEGAKWRKRWEKVLLMTSDPWLQSASRTLCVCVCVCVCVCETTECRLH